MNRELRKIANNMLNEIVLPNTGHLDSYINQNYEGKLADKIQKQLQLIDTLTMKIDGEIGELIDMLVKLE